MPALSFGPEICQNLEEATSRAWLLANSVGAFSCSTIPMCHTTSYHGLLVVPVRAQVLSPGTRYVLLSGLDDTLVIGEDRYPLSTQRYADGFFQQGFQHLARFDLGAFPVFTYRIEELMFEKHIELAASENTLLVRYRVLEGPRTGLRLEVRPLLAYRHVAQMRHQREELHPALETSRNRVRVSTSPVLPPLYVMHQAVIVDKSLQWYRNVEYGEEASRARDAHEDLFSPFALHYVFEHRAEAELSVSTQDHGPFGSVDKLVKTEEARRKKLAVPFQAPTPLFETLRLGADRFFVARGRDLAAIVRRFPRMEESFPDMLRALPGLALTTRSYDRAGAVLAYAAQFFKRGALPGRLGAEGEELWDAPESALWWILACFEYGEASEDFARIERRYYPLIRASIASHVAGHVPGLEVSKEGLLAVQSGSFSRSGEPLLLQALWYNALRSAEAFAVKFRDRKTVASTAELAGRVADAVNRRFWMEELGTYAAWRPIDGVPDTALRPDQVFLVSLPFALAPAERWPRLLVLLEKNLLTPFGLRTLSVDHPSYEGRAARQPSSGEIDLRRGAVDPATIGPYCLAQLRASGYTASAAAALGRLFRPLEDHVRKRGLAGISEAFDGDPPHAPHGDPWCALAAGEVLRALEAIGEAESGRARSAREMPRE